MTTEPCSCDEATHLRGLLKAARSELDTVKRERDYLLTGCSSHEIRVMKQELLKEDR